MPVSTDNATATTPNSISMDPRAVGTTKAGRRVAIPFTIPKEQEYYWHRSWQGDERAALAEREAGKTFRFDSDDPEDAARFLDEGDLEG